ncbi:MAG: hypothetical protein IJO93_03985 [Clostridia bacterium]|nr:hypothetical protein [Clostridia bacterium]
MTDSNNSNKTICAGIKYHHSMNISFSSSEIHTQEEYYGVIEENLRRNGCSYIDISNAKPGENAIADDFRITSDFLHGGGIPFAQRRYLLTDIKPELIKFPLSCVAVILTVFQEHNIAQICYCFEGEFDTDNLIYLRHIIGDAQAFVSANDKTEQKSLKSFTSEIAEKAGVSFSDVEMQYLCEFRRFFDYDSVADIIENEPKRVYGILCGDEGWQFVSQEVVRARLSNSWSSRNFMRYVTFGNNAGLFNLIGSTEYEAYLKREDEFGNKIYGGVNDYFTLKSHIAGLNHGIIYAEESILLIKTAINRILHRNSAFKHNSKKRLGAQISETRSYRNELIRTLNEVENLEISELGELEQLLIGCYRVSPLIEDAKYLLEMLDSELGLLYQQRTNQLVNFLTIAGLLLTVIGLLL